jgi:tetratricopeptide (TPR) repeat protein
MRFIAVTTLGALLWLGQALANGGGTMGGDMPMGSSDDSEPRTPSPDSVAKSSYNRGVKEIQKAKKADAEAGSATDAAKKKKAEDKARAGFLKARDDFMKAVDARSDMYQAWNYIGYAQRKLGNYEEALAAYDQALKYSPAYGDAIEYRAEAYLALDRLDDAKSAYLLLFRDARPLAAELLTSMQKWIVERRADHRGLTEEQIDAFAKWVDERAAIAQKAEALGIGGSATASWK